MQRSIQDLLSVHHDATERRLAVGEQAGTEFVLAGGGLLWVADRAPSWAVRRMLERFRREVQEGFGDGRTRALALPPDQVDL
ncbi:MAG: hypothetical protein R2991_08620 [Thermoanaerobaculia bacterium]